MQVSQKQRWTFRCLHFNLFCIILPSSFPSFIFPLSIKKKKYMIYWKFSSKYLHGTKICRTFALASLKKGARTRDLWKNYIDRSSSTRSKYFFSGLTEKVSVWVVFYEPLVLEILQWWMDILEYRQSDSASLCFRVEWSVGYFSIRDFTTESLILAQDER